MLDSIAPALALSAGLAMGPALEAYAAWIVRCRRGALVWQGGQGGRAAAALVNGFGWLLAWLASPTAVQAAELGLTVSLAVVLTAIDVSIRVIPNELVLALLCLWTGLSVLERGAAGLPGRLAGLAVEFGLFALAARPGKGRKLAGGGDVKLAAAAGFAAGFPGALVSALLAALAALAAGSARRGGAGRKAPMPYAGFIMVGLAAALLLERTGALTSLAGK